MSVTKELIKVADTFFKSNKYEEALEGYERVPQEERSARVLVNQSACLSHVGNFSQAEVVAREALVVKPDLVKVLFPLLSLFFKTCLFVTVMVMW